MRKQSLILTLLTIVAFSLAGSAMAIGTRADAGVQPADDEVHWAIDNPRPGDVVSGLIVVKGYVLDFNGVSNIDLYVKGPNDTSAVYVRSADHDLARVDVNEIYPQYNGTPGENPGFQTGFLARNYPTGSILHIELHITFSDGSLLTPYPSVDVNVDNTKNQPPFGNLELPRQDESLTGPFPIVGWALDGNGFVKQADVLIDGQVKYGAVMGDFRPDVENAFGVVPGADGAGFTIWVDTNTMSSGTHQIAVRITDDQGLARTLGPRRVQVFNNGVNQPPFGKIDVPLYDSELQSALCTNPESCPISPCTTFSYLDDVYFVCGWALDVGSRADKGAVAYVELLMDGALVWNTRTDCFDLGGVFPRVPAPLDDAHVNCYGYFRPDVNHLFPGFTASANCGWCFAIDIYNQFLNNGYVEGLHYLTVRAGDVEEGVSNIDSIPIKLTCPSNPDWPTIGYIDAPYDYEFVNGTIKYEGWAIDRDGLTNGLTKIRVWVDGVDMGSVTYGITSPDVTAQYPNYPIGITANARFFFYLDTTLISDGEHDTYVTVVDSKGNTNSFIGTRRIVVDNNVN